MEYLLKSIIFISDLPKTFFHTFNKVTKEIIIRTLGFFQNWDNCITFTFKRFEFWQPSDYVMIFSNSEHHRIKLYKCRLNWYNEFKAQSIEKKKSSVYINYWEILDENQNKSISSLRTFIAGLIKCSYLYTNIYFEPKIINHPYELWDLLVLNDKDKSLEFIQNWIIIFKINNFRHFLTIIINHH